MKKMILLFVLFFQIISNTADAQIPGWVWAKYDVSPSYGAAAGSIATDKRGNVYVTGSFSSKVIILGNDTLYNADTISASSEFLLVKYDSNGNYLWAKCAHGINSDGGVGVVIDKNDNVFVSGTYASDSIVFDNHTLYLTNGGAFLMKYDPSGNIVWIEKGTMGGVGIAIDSSDNIYMAGECYSNPITWGGITSANNGATSFVVKFESNGNADWIKTAIGSGGPDRIYALSTDARGNVSITGGYNSQHIKFGSITLYNSLQNGWKYDVFVVKYDTYGNVLWANTAGGDRYDAGEAIASDDSGNVIVSGYFMSQKIVFGNDTLINKHTITYAADNGRYNYFIVKYNSSGQEVWARAQIDSLERVDIRGIITDASGNIYTTGDYTNSKVQFGNYLLLNNGGGFGFNIFIAKYNPGGYVGWAKWAGGYEDDQDIATAITKDCAGNILITGVSSSTTLQFDNWSITKDTSIFHSPYVSIITAKLSNDLKVTPVEQTENGQHPSVEIVPNPTAEKLFVNGVVSPTIQVYNFLGQQLIVSTNSNEVDVSSLPNGLYFVLVYDQYHTLLKTEKIFKE